MSLTNGSLKSIEVGSGLEYRVEGMAFALDRNKPSNSSHHY